MSDQINVHVPGDASAEEEQRLIDEAIDRKVDKDLDDVLGGFGK
jgi:hypothetical protein